jgi:hypothetical protein
LMTVMSCTLFVATVLAGMSAWCAAESPTRRRERAG